MATKIKPKEAPPLSPAEKLDALGLDAICEAILNLSTMKKIAVEQKIAQSALVKWISATEERSARVKEARKQAAVFWDEAATELISNAVDEFDLKKAREIAHHYRWRASKIAPQEYGDKMTLAGDPNQPIHTETTLNVTGLSTQALAEIMAARDAAEPK